MGNFSRNELKTKMVIEKLDYGKLKGRNELEQNKHLDRKFFIWKLNNTKM